jgi:hypothetical protein
MLPQAAGAELGMTLSELQKARPGVRFEYGEVRENVASERWNEYWFSSRNQHFQASRSPGIRGTLSAVDMWRTVETASDYLTSIESVSAVWSAHAGMPVDSMVVERQFLTPLTPVRRMVRIWRAQDIALIVESDYNPAMPETLTLTAAVLDTALVSAFLDRYRPQ